MTQPLMDLELPGFRKLSSGKVREMFDAGEHLLIVTTDRLSAFDCVLPTGIPRKGEVLNRLSLFWFDKLAHVTPGHVVTGEVAEMPGPLQPFASALRGRSMLVRKAKVFPVECIVRGYLSGSGWAEYQRAGTVCGIPLPEGLRESAQLPEPIFTPSTKAEKGHDENIPFERMVEIVGPDWAGRIRATALALYSEAAAYARDRGIIIADTKFEFGLVDGQLALIDEVLTPDSSRFWPAESYREGATPPSFDKQFVRDYLSGLGWDKRPPAPALPEEVARRTSEKYVDAYRLLTGTEL